MVKIEQLRCGCVRSRKEIEEKRAEVTAILFKEIGFTPLFSRIEDSYNEIEPGKFAFRGCICNGTGKIEEEEHERKD